MLELNDLSGGYAGEDIVRDISFKVEEGELFGILGPNGSGKTTLLKIISGLLPNSNGELTLQGKPLTVYSSKELARVMAVLPQHTEQFFSYTVKETVSLGRYSHKKGLFQTWKENDEETVQKVMKQTGVAEFQAQYIHELSGGERQRVFLAQALAQEPEVLLLDEPTNHLDLSYQKELLDMLKKLTNERKLTVISIFHDLNLAGLYCDRILLLEKGKIVSINKPNEVLKEERIRAVYKTSIQKQYHPEVPKPQLFLIPEDQEQRKVQINESCLRITDEYISLSSEVYLKCMSSGVTGSGTGWFQTFVNRHVPKTYCCNNHLEEMSGYLRENGFDPSETIGMMTAVILEDVSYRFFEEESFSVFIVVTAGTGNAVDASSSRQHEFMQVPGTINTWVFVNGNISEEAFIQSIMTATEAKVKVLQEMNIKDRLTDTLATGTSTDSILIAATQTGEMLQYAGTATPLGKLIGHGVYTCTSTALKNYLRRGKQ
ncbi:ATP-binding cassette domain-containing protein [Peribacillus saganii]|uniref:ATP-binding cassette domain-containing protein n=1 Tax=Peribacillus saganii TaxID=2303992 RepID=A0A372LTR9_9BACI|nr:adenosylcobinamide amidohydrolase [Peribacillus saganii]RFU71456.1 ATP-binding cassette domain-containing protein [Peribacillus saganii]